MTSSSKVAANEEGRNTTDRTKDFADKREIYNQGSPKLSRAAYIILRFIHYPEAHKELQLTSAALTIGKHSFSSSSDYSTLQAAEVSCLPPGPLPIKSVQGERF